MQSHVLPAFALGLLATLFSADNQADEANFYRCPNGYELQVKGQSVRCFKPESFSYVRPLRCPSKPAREQLTIDYRQLEDKCVGSYMKEATRYNSITNLQCPNGFSLEVRKGRDRCKRHTPAKFIAPKAKK